MLRALEQALAEQAARADGDLRLLQVVAFIGGCRAGLVHEHEQTVALILLEQLVLARGGFDDLVYGEHRHDGGHEQSKRYQQALRVSATHDQGERRNAQIHQTGAQVGLRHDAQKRHHHDAQGLHILARIVQVAAVARHDRGIHEDDGDLGELAGLDLHAQLDPTFRAHAGIGAEPRYVRRHDEHHVDDKEQRGVIRQAPVIEPPHQDHEHKAHGNAAKLAAVLVIAVSADGGIHDDQAVSHQQRDHDGKRQVQPRETARLGCS